MGIFFDFFLFRRKPDQEAAMWLNMVEAHQSAQPQKQNHDLAIPKAVLLVKWFVCINSTDIYISLLYHSAENQGPRKSWIILITSKMTLQRRLQNVGILEHDNITFNGRLSLYFLSGGHCVCNEWVQVHGKRDAYHRLSTRSSHPWPLWNWWCYQRQWGFLWWYRWNWMW